MQDVFNSDFSDCTLKQAQLIFTPWSATVPGKLFTVDETVRNDSNSAILNVEHMMTYCNALNDLTEFLLINQFAVKRSLCRTRLIRPGGI